MIVQICVGSSCHIKGSHEIVELMKQAVKDHGLEDEVVLAGCFCTNHCNRVGVTVQVDDDVHTGINTENFEAFFKDNILDKIKV